MNELICDACKRPIIPGSWILNGEDNYHHECAPKQEGLI